LTVVILHGHDRSLDIEGTVGIAQVNPIGEFQRVSAGEQRLALSAEFNDGVLGKWLGGTDSLDTNRDAGGRGVRKEICQLADAALGNGTGSGGGAFGAHS
jgi:hypothetical protein